MTKDKRQLVLKKYDNHCAYCGVVLIKFQADHIIPKERWHQYERELSYELDSIENLNPSCAACNNLKHSFMLEEFRQQLNAQVRRAKSYSVNFRTALRYGMISIVTENTIFYFEKLQEKKNG